jgi:hypothetical protein
MALKHTILARMELQQLRSAIGTLDLEDDADLRSIESMCRVLSRMRRATTDFLLNQLGETQVKEVCREWGISDTGRKRKLIERLQSDAPAPEEEEPDSGPPDSDESDERVSRGRLKKALLESMSTSTARSLVQALDLAGDGIDQRIRSDMIKVLSRKGRANSEVLRISVNVIA